MFTVPIEIRISGNTLMVVLGGQVDRGQLVWEEAWHRDVLLDEEELEACPQAFQLLVKRCGWKVKAGAQEMWLLPSDEARHIQRVTTEEATLVAHPEHSGAWVAARTLPVGSILSWAR